ncbi:dihydroorotase [Ruminococcaceae bacterium OttesenSCG-928-D13]|nr:dihydroorotase [Ruminococcaceae bacterium OttesenSCG-928-D13]
MATNYDLLIHGGSVWLGRGFVNADIAVEDGRVAALLLREGSYTKPGAKREYNAAGKQVLPGSIDPHVHIRAPGMEQREDFFSGSCAAAAGGVTTFFEHPIANPPQYSLEILNKRIAAAEQDAVVDFAFYGAAGSEFPDQMQALADSGRIVAFKTFLHEAPPGRDSEFMGLTMKSDPDQYYGLGTVGKLGAICAVHAENNDMINAGIARCRQAGDTGPLGHGHSRPPVTEYETVAKLLLFAKETGARIEFCHISTPEAMEMIVGAKRQGLDVYLETCPHYLLMDEHLMEQHGPYAKCNPPLRDRATVEALWKYVNDGSVDFIGSDHAPYTYEEKSRGYDDIFDCPSGFPGLETRLPLMLDAVAKGRLTMARMIELLCENPARLFGLYPRKGTIRLGADADFTVVDQNAETVLSTAAMYTKCRDAAMLYEGMRLSGAVLGTIVRGRVVYQNGKVDEAARGHGVLCKPNQ